MSKRVCVGVCMVILLSACETREQRAGRQVNDSARLKLRDTKVLLPIGGFEWMQE